MLQYMNTSWYIVPGVVIFLLAAICVCGFTGDAIKEHDRKNSARWALVSVLAVLLTPVWPVIVAITLLVLIGILVRWSITG